MRRTPELLQAEVGCCLGDIQRCLSEAFGSALQHFEDGFSVWVMICLSFGGSLAKIWRDGLAKF